MKPILACVIFLSWACCVLAGQSASPSALIIRDVTVIDVTGGPAQAHRTVVVRDGKIQDISIAVADPNLTGIVVDGRGRFLIPGLWDMHVHMVFGDWFPRGKEVTLPLFISNSVTA